MSGLPSEGAVLDVRGVTVGSPRTGPPGAFDEVGGGRGVDVLPDSEHQPSVGLKSPVIAGVTRTVQGELVPPPRRVGPGSDRVIRTAMPETAVHLDSNAGPGEDDVGPAREAPYVHPVAEASAVKLPPEGKFRSSASRPQPRHELCDLGRGRRRVSAAAHRRGH